MSTATPRPTVAAHCTRSAAAENYWEPLRRFCNSGSSTNALTDLLNCHVLLMHFNITVTKTQNYFWLKFGGKENRCNITLPGWKLTRRALEFNMGMIYIGIKVKLKCKHIIHRAVCRALTGTGRIKCKKVMWKLVRGRRNDGIAAVCVYI